MTSAWFSLIALAAFAAAPALQPQPEEASTTPAAQADKKVCRMIVPTGSIMAKRFCLTKQEWKDMNNQTSDSASSALSKRGTGMCDISCGTSPTS